MYKNRSYLKPFNDLHYSSTKDHSQISQVTISLIHCRLVCSIDSLQPCLYKPHRTRATNSTKKQGVKTIRRIQNEISDLGLGHQTLKNVGQTRIKRRSPNASGTEEDYTVWATRVCEAMSSRSQRRRSVMHFIEAVWGDIKGAQERYMPMIPD